jgi:iron(III) transport system permease protein
VLAGFELPGFALFRDSPLPLSAALSILLLPHALLLRFIVHLARDRIAGHAAELLRQAPGRRQSACGRQLHRELRGTEAGLVFWGVFYLAYFALTAAAILAPPGMTPVSVRLYNLMHYGQTPMLAGMVFLAMIAAVLPPAIFLLTTRRRPISATTRRAAPTAALATDASSRSGEKEAKPHA